MSGGFSFCGVDISELKLEYAPENKDTYVYNTFQYNNQEQTFAGHDGGYYYGSTLQPKTFTLRCFYEDIDIDSGLMANINAFFRRGRTGRLVFDKRPWIYYIATVTEVNFQTMYSYCNGLVVIQMKAYNPLGLTDYSYISDAAYKKDMLANSALFETDMNPETEYVISSPTDIYLYNGGTEYANVSICVGGNLGTDGLTIGNQNNRSDCKFVGMTSGSSSKYVECDGTTGNCYWVSSDSSNGLPAFKYHDHGFLKLDPAFPLIRNINISDHESSERSAIIHTTDKFTDDMIDKFICLSYIDSSSVYHADEWIRIASIEDEHTAVVIGDIDSLTSFTTSIATMNVIHVEPSADSGEIYLKFKYKHTFA